MQNTFFADIESLSPTHYFLCEKRLSEVKKHFETHSLEDYPPILVMKFGGRTLITHGHHFAYYISTQGKHIAKVCEEASGADFFLSLKLESQCRNKNVFSVSDLKKRILSLQDYNKKWTEKYAAERAKTDESPLLGLKAEAVVNPLAKLETANTILTPIPEYFANEFIYKTYIEKVSDMSFLSFNVYGHPVAFVALRPVYESALEIYMLGIHEKADMPEIADKIMKEVAKLKKSLQKEYLTVKVPAKSAVHNNARRLHDFYLNRGFTPIESIESPWDAKRLCTLLIKH